VSDWRRPLEALAPLLLGDVTTELLDAETLVRFREAFFPALPAASAGGFECPLGVRRHGASFSIRLHAEDGSLGALRGDLDWGGGPGAGAGAGRLLRELASAISSGSLEGGVQEVWLELDAECAPSRPPNVFVRLPPPYGLGPALGPGPDRRLEDTLSLIGSFTDVLALQARAELISRCVHELPASSRITFLGGMLGRDNGLRLTIGATPVIELTAYLRRIGWLDRYELEPLVVGLRLVKPHVRHVALHLDVLADGLGPRVGMELRPELLAGRVAWEALLRALTEQQGCERSQAGALLRWPRRVHADTSSEPWPELEANDFECTINHLKLVHDADVPAGVEARDRFTSGGLYAKAYLAYAYGSAFPDPTVWES
jgi:hypothetical protein